MKPRNLLPNTEIYKEFIPGRPFFCRGEYEDDVKDEYKINGLELVTLTDKDRNIDVTIFLNLDGGKEWISKIVNGNRGAKSQRTKTENNSSGKLEFGRSGVNLFVLSIYVTIICTEI